MTGQKDAEVAEITARVKRDLEGSMKGMMDEMFNRFCTRFPTVSPSTSVTIESGSPADFTLDRGKKHDDSHYDPADDPLKDTQDQLGELFSKKQHQWMENRFLSGLGGSQYPCKFNVDALNVIPRFQLPENFKTPKFALYDGIGDPWDHLRKYCMKMAPYTHDESMMIYLFQESLSGSASKWFSSLGKEVVQTWHGLAEAFMNHYAFNEQLAMTKEDLSKMKRESTESIKKHAQRWRVAAADVRPPLNERELVKEFKNTLKPEYQMHLAACVNCTFMELVEAVVNLERASEATQCVEDFHGMKHREEPVYTVSNTYPFSPEVQPAYPPQTPHNLTSVNANFSQDRNQTNRRPRKKPKQFDATSTTYADLFQQLVTSGRLTPQPALPVPNPVPRWFNPSVRCEYHSGGVGHSIENCIHFKRLIQNMKNKNQIEFTPSNYAMPNPMLSETIFPSTTSRSNLFLRFQ